MKKIFMKAIIRLLNITALVKILKGEKDKKTQPVVKESGRER